MPVPETWKKLRCNDGACKIHPCNIQSQTPSNLPSNLGFKIIIINFVVVVLREGEGGAGYVLDARL